MSLFLDYFWIWIVLAFAVGISGYVWYVNDQRGQPLAIAIVSPILTLALGLALYYGVDTDRKSVTRMLNALIAAVEKDDSDVVCRFISPKAEQTQTFARVQMKLYRISKAKYHNLEITVNDATSPPIAQVRFASVFYWKNKEPIDGMSLDQPIPQSIRFEIELVKTKEQSWILTKCQPFPLRNF
jgi:hypothetical protein